ncbi:manganese efflux pump MntP [Pantoea sp. Mb-10]|uniref:manganese efflux pump MntP n=1 Tax=unclassified Pantoea TaxID=2630326 RepID=UPI001E4150A6|nr:MULTISPECIES: manganese efflux pump MntP [unclassified Pantoea]MCE0492254.1 manganese efflux pump MntP [Pantoea sp. Mb-10]MCE0503296.1 manganese efflux pump MntP [Pantoea sp. Pb-8]
MTFIATLILAFGMSMDAFAAALGKGATLHRPNFKEALRTGVIFGAIEMITPLIGWAIGLAASRYIMAWDHWVAFGLLSVLGARMMMEGFRQTTEEPCEAPQRHGFMVLALTAVATSLDALAVGVGLAFLQVNIVLTALTIGAATTVMATTGVMVGRFMGPLLGKWAEVLGGVVLICIGSTILIQHLALFR